MFIIADVVIDDDVASASFCCDLPACQGACCFLTGGRGAPLADDELPEIEMVFPVVREYLSRESLRTIAASGLYEGSPGDHATTCVDNRECVFAYFEGGTAQCGLERAYLEGMTSWRKPLSCHLFPVRVRRLGRDYLHYDKIEECHAGRVRGVQQHVPLREFLREPLTRAYGPSWYQEFLNACGTRGG